MAKRQQSQRVTKRQRKLLGDLVLAYLLEGDREVPTSLDMPLPDAQGLKSLRLVYLRKRRKGYVVEITEKGWPIGHDYLKARFPVWE